MLNAPPPPRSTAFLRETEARAAQRAALSRDRDEWSRAPAEAATRLAAIARELADARDAFAAAKDQPAALQAQLDELAAEAEAAEAAAPRRRRHAGREPKPSCAKPNSPPARRATPPPPRARRWPAPKRASKPPSAAKPKSPNRSAPPSIRIWKNSKAASPPSGRRRAQRAPAMRRDAETKADPVALDTRLAQLRRERDQLGAVNMEADEQLTEISDRMGFQIEERDDLVAAIAKLREGIDALNVEGRQRLLDAFEMVNEHFRSLFIALFGGGHAELRLTESDDPLDAGLEIFASPPGKRLGQLSLMSGGEQALTATALIFAVFLRAPPRSACLTKSMRRSTTPMSTAFAACWTRCARAPRRASSSSPTMRSPCRAWTACSASPCRSAASRASSRSTSKPPSAWLRPTLDIHNDVNSRRYAG